MTARVFAVQLLPMVWPVAVYHPIAHDLAVKNFSSPPVRR